MKPKLLIGTKNPGKIKRRSQYFSDNFDVVSLLDCGIDMEVEESLDDLRGNSIKKAKTYAQLSGLLTLSEDTGFFIEALDGMPGVAVRRWGGELPNEISDDEFLDFLKEKIKHLENTDAYFEYEITICTPEGKSETVNKKIHGYIDKERLFTIQNKEKGYPLGICFVNKQDGKARHECTNEEKAKRDEHIIAGIQNILDTI